MDYLEILRKYWGYTAFRGIQLEIIESIGSGRDTLGLMPTGGGKSVTFQVPAMAMEGTCIVITPLIALMNDQVASLRKHGIKAAALHSGMSRDRMLATLDNCVFGAVKILYVSPERIATELFTKKIAHTRVSFITVDEAHCISQWGYDFRPSYLQIKRIRDIVPYAPVLALTATATPTVVDDIQARLGFKEKNVHRMSFERENLAYVVRETDDKLAETLHILANTEGSSIIYTRNRKRTAEIAQMLNSEGIAATHFHAGLDNEVKIHRQQEWQAGRLRVMVATNAFGMGIDKPDVRTVIHYDCPDSIEAYFQEAGRAGRDGKRAYAVLLVDNYTIDSFKTNFKVSFPDKKYVREVYDHLAYYFQLAVDSGYNATFELNTNDFCRRFHHFPTHIEPALRLLEMAGYIEYSGDVDVPSRVKFTVERDDLYRKANVTKEEDQLIEHLLRNHSGLFTDFKHIDEDLIALRLGTTHNAVSQRLLSLSRKHIIAYIPHRKTSYIRYTQRREDSSHLVFHRAIYEERRERAIVRARAMLGYLTEKDKCRSQYLLEYFGERSGRKCSICDTCVSESRKARENETISKRITDLVRAGKATNIDELQGECKECDREQLAETLRTLCADGYIIYKEGEISIPKG